MQNYKNHVRYYWPHHFVFYPVMTILLIISIRMAYREPQNSNLWIAIGVLIFLLAALSFMLRQHYALNNQNRIVRLELRFRYYVLTHERLEAIEYQLTRGQLYALRFASDKELPALVKRAVEEKLSPTDIKKSIRQWLPDTMRA